MRGVLNTFVLNIEGKRCGVMCINSLQGLTGEGFIAVYRHHVRLERDESHMFMCSNWNIIFCIQCWSDLEVCLAFRRGC